MVLSILFTKHSIENNHYRNKQRPTKWEQAKAVYWELAIAGASTTITCVLEEAQSWAEEWKALQEEKGEVLGMPWLEGFGLGKLKVD